MMTFILNLLYVESYSEISKGCIALEVLSTIVFKAFCIFDLNRIIQWGVDPVNLFYALGQFSP